VTEPSSRGLPLYARILIGLAAGIAAGIAARAILDTETLEGLVTHFTKPVGTIWMRLILMTVVPLVFCALATGVAGLGDVAKLGKIGIRTLLFTVLISSFAVIIGLVLVNVFEPGKGLSPESKARLAETFKSKGDQHVANAKAAKTISETLVDIVPMNPIEEAATALSSPRGGMLAVMFFALMFGIGLTTIEREKAEPLVRMLEGAYEVLMKIIAFAMKLAPIGVGALMFSTTATLGLEFLLPLGKYVAVVIAGLLIHQFGVYSLLLRFMVGISPLKFFKQIQGVMATAFSTASSNATLPTSLEVAQRKLGVPKEIATFVLTLGSTANQNGTALFEGVTVLFLAQFFGVELTAGQQISVLMMSVLAGIGTAGVPGGSLPMIVIVMQSVHIPGEGIAIILGVDRILDMCRTALNVTGDLVVTAYVSTAEGHPLKLSDAES
jgi:DAACS family dicarboxylate/amino acid:cation (Na+ or H+) symporter